ncbi:MAG: phosphopantetheine-binding protein [Allosphingosinicella sp.]
MLEPADIAERVLRGIERAQHLPPRSVTLDDTFEELGIESFDAIYILFVLEDEFGVDLPEEAKEYRTVRDAVDGMRRLLEANETSSAGREA